MLADGAAGVQIHSSSLDSQSMPNDGLVTVNDYLRKFRGGVLAWGPGVMMGSLWDHLSITLVPMNRLPPQLTPSPFIVSRRSVVLLLSINPP